MSISHNLIGIGSDSIGGIDSADAVGVAGRRGYIRIVVVSAGGGPDLRETAAPYSLAAFDQIPTNRPSRLRRRRPPQVHLIGVASRQRRARRHHYRLPRHIPPDSKRRVVHPWTCR